MKDRPRVMNSAVALVLLPAILFSYLPARSQDLVPISSLTGGSSVFVTRARAAAKRTFASLKPARSKAQRLETAVKIKKQYENQQAKITVKPNRAKVVDPNKLPPNASRTLPPAQASKLFAGVGEYYVAKGEYEMSFDFFRD